MSILMTLTVTVTLNGLNLRRITSYIVKYLGSKNRKNSALKITVIALLKITFGRQTVIATHTFM